MKRFSKVFLTTAALSAMLAGNALAASYSEAVLQPPATHAEGATYTVTGNMKTIGHNSGSYKMKSKSYQSKFGFDTLWVDMVVSPGTTATRYTDVPHSSYYAVAEPYYVNYKDGYGWTSGYTRVTNY